MPRLLRREHMLNRIREVVNLSPDDLDELDLDTINTQIFMSKIFDL
ncbi:hypothetical protein [Microseira wollei]|nr:hypothetical protein [Microseira wollei]